MKKKIIAGLCLVTIMLTGCTSDADREEAFINSSKKYYEEYMSGLVGADTASVTLDMLLNSPTKENYDLSSLEKCEKTSVVTFELTDGEIINTQVELICK